jgi:hypothetical protein
MSFFLPKIPSKTQINTTKDRVKVLIVIILRSTSFALGRWWGSNDIKYG